jgi:hypothetical protein
LDQMVCNQEKIKETFDNKERQRNFKEGDWVLVWDKRKEKPRVHKMFDSLCTWPYRIVREVGVKSFNLATLDEERLLLLVNRSLHKPYFLDGT